jgi:protein-disulfide isomerase
MNKLALSLSRRPGNRASCSGARRHALWVVFLAAVACSKAPSRPAAGGSSASGNPETPVARIGTQVITAGELDKAAKPKLSRLEAEHAEQVHGAKSEALEAMIDKRLLDDKAKAEGITGDKLLEREVTSKVAVMSDAELHTNYDQMKAQGQQLPPFDEVKVRLAEFLKDRKTAELRKAYVGKLRSEAKVQVLLPPLLPPKVEVAAEGPAKGEDKAPITIVEFSDFQCPFCGRAEETVKQVLDQYKGKVRLVYRDYPLPFHNQAQKASEAAQCAGDQGKYWQMHEKLFANQKALSVPELKDHAKGIGLDASKFDRCLDSGEKAKVVEASKKAGDEAGVNGTPAFFINGRLISGARPFENFKEIIDYELQQGS